MSDGHSHELSHRHGDSSDQTLWWAMVAFGLLGALQLTIAFLSVRIALAVDGLHNLSEISILGINRTARRLEGKSLGRVWTCWILPLAPAFSAILSVVGAIALLTLVHGYHTTDGVWLAFGLELASLTTNGWFALRLHAGHSHDDANLVTAVAHLAGDSAVAGLAMVAYLIIALSQGNTYLDPIAAGVGVLIIVAVHIKPIRNSLREFRRHRRPEHDCLHTP
ncbi:MAG TPA: cation transporter [Candidatus Saccharimonadales bacterium]|nr:cation transporter [Candidatus Saccharimonadales bacterium]